MKASILTSVLVACALSATAAASTDFIFTQCSDGLCTENCRSVTVQPNKCSAADDSSSVHIAYSPTSPEAVTYAFRTFDNAECAGSDSNENADGSKAQLSGLCAACVNGMDATCYATRGIHIGHDCLSLDSSAADDAPSAPNSTCSSVCRRSKFLEFERCVEVEGLRIPGRSPAMRYAYASLIYNGGGFVDYRVATLTTYGNSSSCSSAGTVATLALGVCFNGQMVAEAAKEKCQVMLK